jgi:hypothetical protein
MKKYFKFYPQSNQYYLNYKGLPVNIDKNDFEKMSDEQIEMYIKAKTTQSPKSKQKEDILSHDEGIKEFQKTKNMLQKMKFLDFYKNQENN